MQGTDNQKLTSLFLFLPPKNSPKSGIYTTAEKIRLDAIKCFVAEVEAK